MINDALLAFLIDGRNYPDAPAKIEVRDTHMSRVFLTDKFAYKLKKPVIRDFLDYSTLQARRAHCEEEVKLNRRLAPSVYLAVVPVCATAEGRLHLGGPGEPVEWLVQMRRLPSRYLLDNALLEVTHKELQPVIDLLTRFYRESQVVALDGRQYIAALRDEIHHNADRLAELADGAINQQLQLVVEKLGWFITREQSLLRERARRIVDGHGDPRPEHIYFGAPPAVIDCIEFNRDFRLNDPLDELAFLDMECRYKRNDWIGKAFIETYCAACEDQASEKLLSFYRARRALVRAKLSLWHLEDYPADGGKWRRITGEYLAIAIKQFDQ